jgi:uncharacterized protein YdaU (DUF1376 family)
MAKSPAFQFYAADFLTDTAEMTDQEVGVYIRLLSHQWVNGSLHSDPNRLANGVAIGVVSVWDELKHKFPVDEDGRRRNPRLEETRQQQQAYRDKQAEAGREGAKKRWAKDSKPNSDPIGDANSNPNDGIIALQLQSSSSSSTPPTETVAAKSPTKPRKKKEPAPSTFVWQSYSDAYYRRYNIEPVRNATVNGQLSNFIKRVPIDEAPHIAAFYVSHNNSFYVNKMHPIGIMLSDAEKLRTEWATNKQMTRQTAQQVDERQSVSNTAIEAQRILDERQGR